MLRFGGDHGMGGRRSIGVFALDTPESAPDPAMLAGMEDLLALMKQDEPDAAVDGSAVNESALEVGSPSSRMSNDPLAAPVRLDGWSMWSSVIGCSRRCSKCPRRSRSSDATWCRCTRPAR